MPHISRRDLLASGLALSASSVLARSVGARASDAILNVSSDSSVLPSAVAPREKLLFDADWKFTMGNANDPARDLDYGMGPGEFAGIGNFRFAKVSYDDSKWGTLNLPHDWAVELPFVWDEEQKSHGFKPLGRCYPETSVGWYRREFEIPASDKGKRIWIEFDGVLQDTMVFVNGCFIGRNDNGYAPFRFDLTSFLTVGANNYIVLRVDASFGYGWFYEGAGIYRHVWLSKSDPLHLGTWESYVRAGLDGKSATLSLGTCVVNDGTDAEPVDVRWEIFDPSGIQVSGEARASRSDPLKPGESVNLTAQMKLPKPLLWSVDEPISTQRS